jgi:putative SOS response-associated peptidase YedK
MSTQFESLEPAALYTEAFHVASPSPEPGRQVWPRQPGVFLRRRHLVDEVHAEAVPHVDGVAPTEAAPEADQTGDERDALIGQFGLVPTWVKSASDAKLRSTKLVNARAEALTTSNAFRGAWLGAQRCIVPMMSFQEDDFRTGKAVPTRIARVDGRPMGVAGLWERWEGLDGASIVSFCLITVNANSHALMHRYQQPGAEKRMPAILNEGAYSAWLSAHPDKAREFLRAYPANWLTANPVQKKPPKSA